MRNKYVVNSSNVEWKDTVRGEKFHQRRKDLTRRFRDSKLLASLYEIPPGKSNWPYHYHCANEEALYILEGKGELRLDGKNIDICAGDYIRFATGPGGAHQILNTGTKPLKYLDIGTAQEPDVVVYPDSEKIAVFAGAAPGQKKDKSYLNKYLDACAEKGYWDGEI